MATSATTATKFRESALSLWLLPNLLSLDAPIIALLWQSVIADDVGFRLAFSSRLGLAMTVWLIYLLDRLLDTRRGMPHRLTARHSFFRTYRKLCYLLVAVAVASLALALCYLPLSLLRAGLILTSVVAAYFVAVHFTIAKWLPKEMVVGFVFASGASLAPFCESSKRTWLVFPALLFGMLCWVNAASIEVWEGGKVDPVSAWAVHHFKLFAVLIAGSALLVGDLTGQYGTAFAIASTCVACWAVEDRRSKMSADFLRVAIDLPLLTPLLFARFY